MLQKADIEINEDKLDVVASPVPVRFWVREMLWRDENLAGKGIYSWPEGGKLLGEAEPTNMGHPAIGMAKKIDPQARDFLFWSRMPMAQIEDEKDRYIITVKDQRFEDPLTGGRFTLQTTVPKDRLDKPQP